jgi:hypothetical protein
MTQLPNFAASIFVVVPLSCVGSATDLLDVVVRQGSTILELFAGENQALLVGWNALLVLDLRFDIVNRVRRLDLEGDGLAREGLHEAVFKRQFPPPFDGAIGLLGPTSALTKTEMSVSQSEGTAINQVHGSWDLLLADFRESLGE